MRLVEFKKPMVISIDNKKVKVKSKAMYLFSDIIWDTFRKKLAEIIIGTVTKDTNLINTYVKKVVKVDENIDSLLKKFNINDFDKFSKPIILRTGGIGDLIALSSISSFIPNILGITNSNLSFVSQEKYRAVFDWFENPIKFISYFAPVSKWASNNVLSKNKVYEKNRPIYYEGVIENSNENWFDLQYREIGVNEIDQVYGRPRLRKTRPSNKASSIDKSKKSILINPRSTAIIRSMMFADIYNSIIDVIKDNDINLYVHVRNLSDEDKRFIIKQKKIDDRIKIIKADSLGDFFLDAFDVDLTVSVDTALLHFREGVGRAGVGIYGPFPKECRTKYYKHTLSFDIRSDCTMMPCYIHVKKPDEICDFQRDLMLNYEYNEDYKLTAPCCCSKWNSDVVSQISTNMKTYVLNCLEIS